MEGIALLRRAAAELRAGHLVVESVVLSSRGSVSRGAGARMLTLADGSSLGTVGGGNPELACQRIAAEVMADGCPRRVTLDHGTTGMVCGGVQEAGVRRLGPADLPALDEALACVDAGGVGTLSVDWGRDVPVFTFARGGAEQDAPAVPDGVFRERVIPPTRVLIFGGGHVGRALAAQLGLLDMDVVVYDDRPEIARADAFPSARAVLCGAYDDPAVLPGIRPTDAVCVMTASYGSDVDVLAYVLPHHPFYLGCMGSVRKGAVVRGILAERGFAEGDISRIDLPIGLDIGAVTPAEIAVAIAARLIRTLRAA